MSSDCPAPAGQAELVDALEYLRNEAERLSLTDVAMALEVALVLARRRAGRRRDRG